MAGMRSDGRIQRLSPCVALIVQNSLRHAHWLGSHFTFSSHFELRQLVSSRTVTGCKHLTALSLQQQQQLQPPHPHTQVQLESQPHSIHSSFHQSVYQCKNNCHWRGCTAHPLILAALPPPQSKTKAFICTCMSVTGIHLQSRQFIPPQWQSSSPPVSLPGSQWRLTGQLPAAAISAS